MHAAIARRLWWWWRCCCFCILFIWLFTFYHSPFEGEIVYFFFDLKLALRSFQPTTITQTVLTTCFLFSFLFCCCCLVCFCSINLANHAKMLHSLWCTSTMVNKCISLSSFLSSYSLCMCVINIMPLSINFFSFRPRVYVKSWLTDN